MPTNKIFMMASKPDCPFCAVMKPIFEEVVKDYTGLPGLSFGQYNVEEDDWAFADKLEIEGVPAFAIISAEEDETIYEINNDGLIEKPVLVSMIINNIGKD